MTHASYHKPVLLNEAIHHLVTDPNGVYIDGTLGGGGHSASILDKLSARGRLIAVDQDDDAIAFAGSRFQKEPRITILRGNFGFLDVIIPDEIANKVSGILLDLGVSSHQIDVPERGFSFQNDGPLDMRMGGLHSLNAAQIVNEYDYEALRDLFFEFGEERESKKVAKSIISRRPMQTTAELRDAVAAAVSERFLNKSLARIFQALRIAVNSELSMLERALEKGTGLLIENGRFVVITYHSLEDRICKNFFRYGNFEGKPVKDFYGNEVRPLGLVNKKVVAASETEKNENPRSRSAKLRAAFKLSGTAPSSVEHTRSSVEHTRPAGGFK